MGAWQIDGTPATPPGPTSCRLDCGADMAMRLFLPASGQIVAVDVVVNGARGVPAGEGERPEAKGDLDPHSAFGHCNSRGEGVGDGDVELPF